MILTDGCHLVSDESVQELRAFARTTGLPPRWFQDHRYPHYDLFGHMPHRAMAAGAIFVTTRQLVRHAVRKEPAPA